MTVNEEAVEGSEVGVLELGQPGSVRELHVHLTPGRYILLCNMSGPRPRRHARDARGALMVRGAQTFQPFAMRARDATGSRSAKPSPTHRT
jgi:hypothetical protein